MSKDYEIGKGRPPKHSQFRKGQSGNPAGRKPGSKNLATLIATALNEKLVVTDKGRRRTVTKRELIIRQLTDRAAGADLKAIRMLLDLVQQFEASAPPPVARTLTVDDQAVLKGLRKRLFGKGDDDAQS